MNSQGAVNKSVMKEMNISKKITTKNIDVSSEIIRVAPAAATGRD
jgi:hypothetical protein